MFKKTNLEIRNLSGKHIKFKSLNQGKFRFEGIEERNDEEGTLNFSKELGIVYANVGTGFPIILTSDYENSKDEDVNEYFLFDL